MSAGAGMGRRCSCCTGYVMGGEVPDCGHYVAEEKPEVLAEAFEGFFTCPASTGFAELPHDDNRLPL